MASSELLKNYLVIDTETNCFLTDGVRICQFGFCIVQNGELHGASAFNVIPDEGMYMSKGAEETHGLSLEKLAATGIPRDEAMDIIRNKLIGEYVEKDGYWLVGHNLVGFDAPLLQREFKRLGMPQFEFPVKPCVDTGAVVKAHQAGEKAHRKEREILWDHARRVHNMRLSGIYWNLDYCLEQLEVNIERQTHDAEEDCMCTHLILEAMRGHGVLDEVLWPKRS